MKYIDEFRDGQLAKGLAAAIRAAVQPGRTYRFMEFCGGHTHAISRYGVTDLLPPNVRMVHGPGCPVCVLPIGRIDMAIRLVLESGAILCTYGDCLRVPASDGLSLLKAKSRGGDVRMLYSAADALKIAREHPAKQVVFFAIGFETTTPPTAVVIKQAAAEGLRNFSVLCSHVLTPAAIVSILELSHAPNALPAASPASSPQAETGDGRAVPLDGFVGPAHVSTIIGSQPYEYFAAKYRQPVVIAGFEPLDVMQAILMLIRQVNDGRAEVENEFTRAVSREGNRKAQQLVADVFEMRRSFEWRGMGSIADSALAIRSEYADFDAERRFALDYHAVPDHQACDCGAILRGLKEPRDCKLFGTVCTPENPIGACMVSSEGACAAHYTYGRYRTAG